MPDTAKPTKAARPAGARRRWAKPVGIGAALLVLFLVIAGKAGLLGFAWASLSSSMFPSDKALLGYVPGDVKGVAIIDPHQIDEKSLAGGQATLRSTLEGRVEDVKKVTGIDLGYDVDKLLLTPSLVVARGRFNGGKLTDRLLDIQYVKAERGKVSYLVRQGEDALAVIDDEILLYGDEPAIQAAIDAKENGTSLRANEHAVERLDEVGWDQALLVTIRLNDDKPSLRTMLGGATGPRAVTFGVKTVDGADVKVAIEAASPSAAEDLKKALEDHRTKGESIAPHVGAALTPEVLELGKAAALSLDAGSATVHMHAHASAASLDTMAQALGKSDAGVVSRYKTFRLWQLLAP
jgi:hypothetical protein